MWCSKRQTRPGESEPQSEIGVCILIWLSVLLVTGAFVWILLDLAYFGIGVISSDFITNAPANAGRAGGIAPIVVSTLLVLMVCMGTAFPVGVGTAIFLVEFNSEHPICTRIVRRSLDILAAVPSIVFGLFGNAFFCIYLGFGFSILSGGVTLTCMVLPFLIRTAEEALRSVSDEYRWGAAALGLSRSVVVGKVLLPLAMPGLLAGFSMSVGRALAETAALIFTSGYVDRMPGSLWDSGRVMSVHIFDLALNVPGGNGPAHATALILVASILTVNLVGQSFGRVFVQKMTAVHKS